MVGNVERTLTQSSLVTEDLFRMHTLTKLDACTAILEVAKDVYKSGSKTLQYVTDDLQDIMFKIDGDTFNNADYGVFVTDDLKDMEVLEAMKSHAKFALQNDQMAFYQLADIYTSESVSHVRAELKRYYDSKQQQASAAQEEQTKLAQEQMALDKQKHDEDIALKQYINDTNNETRIQVAQIGVYSRQLDFDLNNDGIPDPIALAGQALKEREAASKDFIERLKLQADRIKTQTDHNIKLKELDVKEKEITSREKIEEQKSETALKVAKTNKNKYDK